MSSNIINLYATGTGGAEAAGADQRKIRTGMTEGRVSGDTRPFLHKTVEKERKA